MANRRCDREPEVLSAVMSGAWPAHQDEEVREHVAACASCSDLAVVAAALRADRQDAVQRADLPGSGLVWWRIQLRARREQSRAAVRTLSNVHAAVIAGALAVALAVLGAISFVDPFGIVLRAGSALRAGLAGATGLGILVSSGGLILLGLVAWLVLAPVAVWLAVTDE